MKKIEESQIFNLTSGSLLLDKCRKSKGIGMSNTNNMRVVGFLSTMLVYNQFIEQDGRGVSNEQPPPIVVAHQDN